MSTLTFDLPDSVKKNIEELAAREGFQWEKLAVMVTMDYLRREASAGRREDFEKYLDGVPPAPPPSGDEL